MRTPPPPGKKLVADWVGLKVRARQGMRNGALRFPAGTVLTVREAGGGLRLETEPCKCCGVSIYITRVDARDVEVITGEQS